MKKTLLTVILSLSFVLPAFAGDRKREHEHKKPEKTAPDGGRAEPDKGDAEKKAEPDKKGDKKKRHEKGDKKGEKRGDGEKKDTKKAPEPRK